jgi:hypothetical protein
LGSSLRAMTGRSVLLLGLFVLAGGCSSSSTALPGDPEAVDAAAEDAVASDDGIEAGDPTTAFESGSPPVPRDAGTAEERDAGPPPTSMRVSCSQPALGVCQSAVLSGAAAARYSAQCTTQGGTAEPCPTAGVVGCCLGDTSRYCYYSDDYTLSTAQMDCSVMGGTWSATM